MSQTLPNNPLKPYQWKNRILLVFSQQPAQLQHQLSAWEADSNGLENRDLIIFSIQGNKAQLVGGEILHQKDTDWLYEQYNSGKKPFLVILIGKDGTEKLKSVDILSTDRLFAVIDAMPMRQQEMKDDFR